MFKLAYSSHSYKDVSHKELLLIKQRDPGAYTRITSFANAKRKRLARFRIFKAIGKLFTELHCFPTIRQIAETAEADHRTVRKTLEYLAELELEGAIHTELQSVGGGLYKEGNFRKARNPVLDGLKPPRSLIPPPTLCNPPRNPSLRYWNDMRKGPLKNEPYDSKKAIQFAFDGDCSGKRICDGWFTDEFGKFHEQDFLAYKRRLTMDPGVKKPYGNTRSRRQDFNNRGAGRMEETDREKQRRIHRENERRIAEFEASYNLDE